MKLTCLSYYIRSRPAPVAEGPCIDSLLFYGSALLFALALYLYVNNLRILRSLLKVLKAFTGAGLRMACNMLDGLF